MKKEKIEPGRNEEARVQKGRMTEGKEGSRLEPKEEGRSVTRLW